MRTLLIVLLSVSNSLASNVTQAQVQQAQQGSQAVFNCAVELLSYTSYANSLFNSNFELSVNGSTSTVTIPNALKNSLIDTTVYAAKKQKCLDAYNTLP
jgi:hypothetical protein